MTNLQKVFTFFMSPAQKAAAEAESKLWMLQCPNCQAERSYWETGGIRYKAAGHPRIRGKCPTCGQTVWFTVYKKGEPATAGNPPVATPPH